MTITAEGRDALARASMSEVLVAPQHAPVYTAHLTTFAHTTKEQGAAHYAETIAAVEQVYGVEAPRERTKPFIFDDGVAIIPVHGILLNRFNSCWGFATGYNFIRAQLNAALADDDVTLIVFDVNSPGGDAAGCFELSSEIRASRERKPSIAVVDDLGASGGYAIPAAATRMVCTPSGTVGSIGVYRMHIDLSEAMARDGVKFTFIQAGEHKTDGNPYEALPDDVRADMQASVDKRWDEFIADVVASRGLDSDAVRDTQARVYRADEALALSLIDDVSTPTEAVSAFLAELASDVIDEEDDENMALPKNETELATLIAEARAEGVASVAKPDEAKIAADAVKADRDRRTSITALDEAKDRPKLAATLAETEGMTAETAKAILAAAATEKIEAPAKAEDTAFKSAMDKSGGAGVTAQEGNGSGEGGDPEKPNIGQQIASFIPANRRLTAVK